MLRAERARGDPRGRGSGVAWWRSGLCDLRGRRRVQCGALQRRTVWDADVSEWSAARRTHRLGPGAVSQRPAGRRTKASARPDAASCAASASRSRGVGCGGSQTVPWPDGFMASLQRRRRSQSPHRDRGRGAQVGDCLMALHRAGRGARRGARVKPARIRIFALERATHTGARRSLDLRVPCGNRRCRWSGAPLRSSAWTQLVCDVSSPRIEGG